MKKTLSAHDRALQIELVRARAAIERQNLRHNVCDLMQAVRPGALLRNAIPEFSGSKGGSLLNWAFNLLSLSRRYPLLTTGASALLSGAGRRHRLLKMGLGLFVAWQISRSRPK